MKISVLVFVITVAYVASFPTPSDESHHIEGQCYYKNVNFKEGAPAPAPIGVCRGILCFNGLENKYVLHGCNRLTYIPENCKYPINGDLSFPWPDCCPKLVCQEQNTM